ncbi:MAG TPA: DUF362 domain-containing protein [Bacillota bacterium]|nr:DUF362 domain-containing protein [Bacillota bacterium]
MLDFQKSRVSIVKCREYEQFEAVKTAVKQVTDLIGGLESIITPGDQVLLKPNLLCASNYQTGATTNPNIIFAVAELCREVGAKRVIVAEGACIGDDTDQVFDALGIRELAARHQCGLVNLLKDEFQYVVNPLGRKIKRIRLPRTFIESNVVINLPVMKTHDALAVSLGLKNLKGIIHSSDKKRFHKWGLAQAVVDLGQLALPELTIMDGTVGLEGVGPIVGNPVGLGLMLASTDTIAVDRVSMEIMGFGLEEVDYLRMAGEQGLGCTDLSQITILGEDLDQVKRPFARLSLDLDILNRLRIRLLDCDACSGCHNAISAYLNNLQIHNRLETLQDSTLVYGQNASAENLSKVDGRMIRLGICTRNLPGAEGIYVPGCPPHPFHIHDFLAGKGLEKE